MKIAMLKSRFGTKHTPRRALFILRLRQTKCLFQRFWIDKNSNAWWNKNYAH